MKIDVWSDFACPWCALGLYRLHAALSRFEHGDAVEVLHRSFELDPRAPAQRGQTMEQVVAAKYALDAAQVEAGHQRLVALGREVGLVFAFGRVRLGNTFDAHRLARAARGTAQEPELIRLLFVAYFTEGRLLSDHDVLLDVAGAAGLDAGFAAAVLATGCFADDVRADELEAREREIFGVPHFLVNGAWAIPGAQDVDTMVMILRRAWARTEATAT